MNVWKRILKAVKWKQEARPSTTKDLGQDPKGFIIEHQDWLRLGPNGVELIKELKKVPGLKYVETIESDGYYNTRVVHVRNEVGRLIELYIAMDGNYANMPLSEFLSKSLGEAFNGKSPDQLV